MPKKTQVTPITGKRNQVRVTTTRRTRGGTWKGEESKVVRRGAVERTAAWQRRPRPLG